VYILQDKPYQAQVSANIEPFGTVAVHGDEIADTVQVAKVEPVAEVLSGPQVYNLACLACHGTGVGGAPATGDAALWEPRIAKGYDVLRDHLLNGFQGDAGFMPPKGGRVDLSDEEIMGALDYMIEQT
jgi:cytochrome c